MNAPTSARHHQQTQTHTPMRTETRTRPPPPRQRTSPGRATLAPVAAAPPLRSPILPRWTGPGARGLPSQTRLPLLSLPPPPLHSVADLVGLLLRVFFLFVFTIRHYLSWCSDCQGIFNWQGGPKLGVCAFQFCGVHVVPSALPHCLGGYYFGQ